MDEVEIIFEKLFNYFKVGSIADLSIKLEAQPSTVSSWRQRSAISAIKKKCRELGIYNNIFGDIQSITANSGQVAQNVAGDQKFYSQNSDIDAATYNLFKEAYEKAVDNDDLKGLRVHLMDY